MAETILLVDDEEGIRKVLKISLSDLGYEVHTAARGEEALRLFDRLRPPIIFTDIKMPGMDGISLLQRIKKDAPETEVIMITGHGDMELAIKSLKLEATDFITKPINDDALDIALKRARERIAMRRQIREYTHHLEELVEAQSRRLVEAERLAAVGQAVESMIALMGDMAEDLKGSMPFFNELPCFVAVHNRNLDIVSVNQRFKERLGEGVDRKSWEMYGTTAADRTNCPVGKTFETGRGQRMRSQLMDRTHQEVPVIVHTAPIRNKSGQVELVLEISADISEIKRLQDELHATRQRYELLFEEVPCYITVQAPDLRIVAANRRFKEDFGDIPFGLCYHVYKHREAPCPECPVLKTFEDGKSHQAEMVVMPESSEQSNVLIWTAPIRDSDGNIIHVMEMSTNITQIRQLQDHLSSLGLLIGSISHGIKGMLTGLDGGIYILNDGIEKKDFAEIAEGWEMVRLVVERIRKMVLDILYYAKEREMEFEPVDVCQFSKDLISAFRHRFSDPDISFQCEIPNGLGEAEMDAGRVHSALISILENAADACREAGNGHPGEIRFAASGTDRTIIFDIFDNGVGMDREAMDTIFTLFFSSKGRKGTGLGLYIARHIIQQHGGDITVDSEPGSGTHFRVQLPREIPEFIQST